MNTTLVIVLLTEGYFPTGKYLLISFVLALIVALIVTGSWKAQLKSVHKENAAKNYVKEGSFKLTGRRDTFLYKKTDRTEKPRQENR